MQLTPPGSACSIAIGKGLTEIVPGGLDNLQMVVADADAIRPSSSARGVEVSEVDEQPVGSLRPLQRPRRQPLVAPGAARRGPPARVATASTPRPDAPPPVARPARTGRPARSLRHWPADRRSSGSLEVAGGARVDVWLWARSTGLIRPACRLVLRQIAARLASTDVAPDPVPRGSGERRPVAPGVRRRADRPPSGPTGAGCGTSPARSRTPLPVAPHQVVRRRGRDSAP